MLGQCAALACPRARQPRLFLLLGRFTLRERCFDVFKGELELVGRQALEPLVLRAKAVIVGLAKQVMHMLVEALQPVAIGPSFAFSARSASRSLIAAVRSAIATSRSAIAFRVSARKLSISFGSESAVVLTRQAEHIRT
jgi:hypothetical protein